MNVFYKSYYIFDANFTNLFHYFFFAFDVAFLKVSLLKFIFEKRAISVW